jgi:formiminoglutamase
MTAFRKIIPPELLRRSNRQDNYETRVANWLKAWDGEEGVDACILGAPFGKAAQSGTSGVAGGPNAVREAFAGCTTYSPDFDVDVAPLRVRDLGDVVMHVTDVLRCHRNIKEAVTEVYEQLGDKLLIVIGGDHSITCPIVEGYCLAHPEQQLGMIHFDAHNDVRSFEAGGPTNGTPIRGLVEGPAKVTGESVVQLGIHGFMNSSYYKRYCENRGITVISSREIRRRGMEAVLDQAMEIAATNTDAIYVTVDIDVLSLPYAFGTGAASAEGLEPWSLLEAMFVLGQHPKVVGLDLVCIDPLRDVQSSTARTGAGILLTFLGGVLLRHLGHRGY